MECQNFTSLRQSQQFALLWEVRVPDPTTVLTAALPVFTQDLLPAEIYIL